MLSAIFRSALLARGARTFSSKIKVDLKAALVESKIKDGSTLCVGGFGLSGTPTALINGVRDLGVKDLTVVSNNCGIDDVGLGVLLRTRQVRSAFSREFGHHT